jgi:hypothetical protein
MAPQMGECLFMRGCDLCSNGHGRHTTRITIVLASWQAFDHVILVMFDTT